MLSWHRLHWHVWTCIWKRAHSIYFPFRKRC